MINTKKIHIDPHDVTFVYQREKARFKSYVKSLEKLRKLLVLRLGNHKRCIIGLEV